MANSIYGSHIYERDLYYNTVLKINNPNNLEQLNAARRYASYLENYMKNTIFGFDTLYSLKKELTDIYMTY